MMFQSKLIKFCSPTLAGIKCGSLFKFKNKYNISIDMILEHYNNMYNQKGLFFFNILEKNDYALIYVYRRENLIKNLYSTEIYNFLKKYGYKLNNLDDDLNHLKYHFHILGATPHEVGLFLGYPLCDVKGFIDNKGKNYKHSGCWKVYDNQQNTIMYFNKCKFYTNLYLQLFNLGIPLDKLILPNKP